MSADFSSKSSAIFSLIKPDDDDGIHILFLLSSLRLGTPNGTAVLDVAAGPITKDNCADHIMKQAVNYSDGGEIGAREEEMLSWRYMLPVPAERCQTREHDNRTYEYIKVGHVPPDDRLFEQTSPFCSCGIGQFPEDDQLGVDMIWASKLIRQYCTRIALSPIFALLWVGERLGARNEISEGGVILRSGGFFEAGFAPLDWSWRGSIGIWICAGFGSRHEGYSSSHAGTRYIL